MNKGINVLSLFDGISCGQVALERAGVKVGKYFASEIDDNAIKITQHNYPNTIQLGSVTEVDPNILPKIFLLQGGSPCQSFSFAGKKNGMSTVDNINVTSLSQYLELKSQRFKFQGQSYLFWEYIRILKEVKPTYFLLENVKMQKKWQDIISDELGVQPIEVNSRLVSAQNRKRLYWTNIPDVIQPDDKGILISDIIDHDSSSYEYVHEDVYRNGFTRGSCWQYDGSGKGHNSQNYRAYFLNNKMACMSYSAPHSKILTEKGVRKTTRLEHERLQTLPEGYTDVILDTNKAKQAIGNGWTVDVVVGIFNYLPKELKH